MSVRDVPRTVGIHHKPDALLYKLRDDLWVERGLPPSMGRWDYYGTGEDPPGDEAEAEAKAARESALEEGLYDELPALYAARLKELVEGDLAVSSALTNKRDMRKVGGPGIEFDLVRLVVEATAVGGGYLVWKEVAKDIRAAVARLRRVSGEHVLVDEGAAIVLAVDALAPPGSPAAVDVRFVASLGLPGDSEWAPARGYLVGIGRGEELSVVAVDPDGVVDGVTRLDGIDFGAMGL